MCSNDNILILSAVASVKEPPGSLATARQGGKPNTSPPSVPEQRSTATAAAGAARPPLVILKGLSYEIDFENVDEN